MKIEAPMLQRIRVRINLIYRLESISFIRTIVRRHCGTITRDEGILRVDD